MIALSFIAGVVLALPASEPSGLDVKESLDQAETYFLDAQFAYALRVLDSVALAHPTGALGARACLLTGLVHQAVGSKEAAESAFALALDEDIDLEMPTFVPPEVQASIESLRAKKLAHPKLSHSTPPVFDLSAENTVELRASHLSRTTQLFLIYRFLGDWKELAMQRVSTDQLKAALPSAAFSGTNFEYYFELRGRGSTEMVRLRGPELPFLVGVRRPAIPVHKQAWFWPVLATTAAVIAGGAVGAYFINERYTPSTGSVAVRFNDAR